MCDWGHHLPSADVFVLNRGIHFKDSAPSEFSRTLEEMTRRLGSRPYSIVYRSNKLPIPDCWRASGPKDAVDSFAISSVNPEWGWPKLQQQDQMMRRILPRSSIFLNVSLLSFLRPDGGMPREGGTTDCVHSCLPGHVDDWNMLLIWALQDTARKDAT